MESRTVHEGWLIKKKSQGEKKLFRPKTVTLKSNQYWFVLKQPGDIPGQYILDYYTDLTCKKQKGQIDLDQCRKIERKIDAIKPDDYLFSIETTKRTYNLLAKTKTDLNEWIQCLCTICGFKPNRPDNQVLLNDQSKSMNSKTQNDFIVISYSNPNLSIDNYTFSPSSPINLNRPINNHLMSIHQSKDKLIDFDVPKKWINDSSTINRTSSSRNNSSINRSFNSSTLPIKKSSFSSAYIPISECHTGKSIFESNNSTDSGNHSSNDKKSTINDEDHKFERNKFSVKFDDEDENYSKNQLNESNKENKSSNCDKNQSLLDCSINSTHNLLLDLNSRSPNQSSDDSNYDTPKQMKIYKKSKINNFLDEVVPSLSSTVKNDLFYTNTKSLPRINHSSSSKLQKLSNNNLVTSNYMNSNELDRCASFRETTKEKEYYNSNLNEYLNTNQSIPPPRPAAAKPINIPSNSNSNSINHNKLRSSSLNSLDDFSQQNNLTEFDPLKERNELNEIPKVPNSNDLAAPADLMYSIPKSQIELEFEKKTKYTTTKNSSLDKIVPLSHSLINSNGKDELHRYTNASTDIFSRSQDGQFMIYDYEKPTLPTLPYNLSYNLTNLNDNLDHQFKIPSFKLNDKTDPMTPSQIVTSTPLFSEQRHFNFNEQDDTVFKPQVNRDLKPKKSDTSSIESLLIYSNKSPNNQTSETLVNRLNSSFHKTTGSSNTTNFNIPRVPSRGKQFSNKINNTNSNSSNKSFNGDIITTPKKTVNSRKYSDNNPEIQYLDLDLENDNISLNSTMNETSINLNFKETAKDVAKEQMNSSQMDSTLNTTQINPLNLSSNLNYSHFIFPNNKSSQSQSQSQQPQQQSSQPQSLQQDANQTNQLNATQNSSINPNTVYKTVYKTVDFIKTKAFNELKDDLRGLNRNVQD